MSQRSFVSRPARPALILGVSAAIRAGLSAAYLATGLAARRPTGAHLVQREKSHCPHRSQPLDSFTSPISR